MSFIKRKSNKVAHIIVNKVVLSSLNPRFLMHHLLDIP